MVLILKDLGGIMKNFFKTITVIALIGISIFFGITYYKTFVQEEVNAEEKPTNNGVNTVLTPTTPTVDKKDEIVEIPKVFRSELPRQATMTSNGFINNVGGYGEDEFKEFYKLANRYFVILQSTSDNCDIEAKGSGIAVAVFDQNGELQTVSSLKSDNTEKYLTSCLYDNGIMIITSSANGVSVYAFDLNGGSDRLLLPIKADNCISYYYSSGVLLACFTGGEAKIFSITNALGINYQMSFSAEGTTKPVALFKSGPFTLFANGDNGGRIFNFELSGSHSSVKVNKILDTIPTKDGYLLATISGGMIYLQRYSYNLDALGTDNLCLGDNAKLGSADTGFYVIVYGTNKQTLSYFLCKHYDVVSINSTDYPGFTDVGEMILHNGSFYFKAVNRKSCSLYRYDINSHTASTVWEVDSANGLKFSIDINRITLFYTSRSSIGNYSNNWGDGDVWINAIEH